jgi:isocitrate lyase
VSWRVFPALLSDLANRLFLDMPEPDARQLFMRKCIVPLSAKIATLIETRLAAAAAAEAEMIHQREEALAAALLGSVDGTERGDTGQSASPHYMIRTASFTSQALDEKPDQKEQLRSGWNSSLPRHGPLSGDKNALDGKLLTPVESYIGVNPVPVSVVQTFIERQGINEAERKRRAEERAKAEEEARKAALVLGSTYTPKKADDKSEVLIDFEQKDPMNDEEKEVVLANYERTRSEFKEDSSDSLFERISKAYVRNLDKVLTRKNP